ncbi:MAG TPA: ABC-F family ATP-binding cassette domain-containing protein [Oceanobacillus sp.]|nr:ABC-F family ATP-binding cassette domain-containing protein [Oceanobacillus sp.]
MRGYLGIEGISKSYGLQQVLNGVSFVLNAGQRIGLVGANGVGKTTLLKIIAGEVTPDSGKISIPPDVEIGYLAQVIALAEGKTIADLIAESMARLTELERRMRTLEAQMAESSGDTLDALMQEYGETAEQFERYGGYEIDYRVDAVFDGLGLGDMDRDRQFATLSGGEKSRAGLALLLLKSPDVLLLDEPTSHLDFAALEWLEDYLSVYRGALLVVSHDRQFLNRTVNVIVEIDEHTRAARQYVGDYDNYVRVKTLERLRWREDYERQQEEIKALRQEIKVDARRNSNYRTHTDGDKFVRNGKIATHDHTVSKKVRAAEEKLRRIEANPIPEPPDDLRFSPEFDPDALKGRAPLYVSGLVKAFGERYVLDEVTFTLGRDSRIVIVGPNGAGKSTLLKILAGVESPDAGEVYVNPAVRIGYLDQEQETLDENQTLFEAYAVGLPGTEQQLKATLIKSGLFRYEEFGKRVGDLSRGQQRKLQIARLIAGKANLLILDESTNSISFDVLEAFEAALRDFPGAIIAASHDRRFIQQFGGDVWALEAGKLNMVGVMV